MSNKKLSKASITVEASIVLPIFILAMYAFIFFIQVISVQQEIQQGLLQTARFCEKIGYVYDYLMNYDVEENNNQTVQSQENRPEENTSEENTPKVNTSEGALEDNKSESSAIDTREVATYLITGGLMQEKFSEVVDQHIINKSCVVGGVQGLNFLLSSYDEETNIADVTVQYRVHIPIGLAIINDFNVIQKTKVRVFVGLSNINPDDEAEEAEDYVYIAETGTVYHESKDCTHLKLSITKVNRSTLDTQRNSSGGRFSACEICKPERIKQEYYYITKQGDRYHCNANCSGLKRTIKVIKRSEVGDRRSCTRCGKQ
jgi:hypothetical protein